MRRLKTVRRPPIYPKTPGHLPCSSLTHPLPLSSRRPSVSFGGFGFREKGANVCYHDPYVPLLDVDGLSMAATELTAEALRDADCVVITTAHSSYDWGWVLEHSNIVVDTRNATHGIKGHGARVVKL